MNAKIATAHKEIAAAQAKEARLQKQVTNSRFLADCEAGLASCSQTHKVGRGPYYQRDASRAAAAAAELKRARPQIAATISGNQNATETVSSPFAVGGCKSLAFKPKFTVSTSGHTNRANGANLEVKLSYPSGSFGQDANIARAKVDLPKQLPSRLTTLQKACPAATFNANPASCPKDSIVGIARATTPILPVPLTGPAYFVSHGG